MAAITVLRTTTTSETIMLTPELLAQAFCEMNSDDQAIFFNESGKISDLWEVRDGFFVQMWDVFTCGKLNKSGRKVFEVFANLLLAERQDQRFAETFGNNLKQQNENDLQ